MVHFGQPVQVRCKAHDDVGLAAVKLSCRIGAEGPWRELPLHRVDGFYRAWLPTWARWPRRGGLVPIALKLEARDAQGNSLTHLLEPAVGLTLGSPRWGRP